MGFISKKKITIFPVCFFFVFLSFLNFAFAINTKEDGWRIDASATINVINADNVCSRVANSSANSYFIPTRTITEWNSFYNNRPSGITISSCKTVKLTWSTTNAVRCIATGAWSGEKATSGNNVDVGYISSAQTYYLECYNSAGVSSGRQYQTVYP